MGQKRKRPKQKQGLRISDENSGSTTRCICEETDSVGLMVQCDKCEVWQHCSCMGLEQPDIPDHYYCEECKPENHKVTRQVNGRMKQSYMETPKRRMTLNSREASMSLEDILAVKHAWEMYKAEQDVVETIEEEDSTVSSVGHDETPIIDINTKRQKTKKRSSEREPSPVYSKKIIPETTTFDNDVCASSPPTKTRQLDARMSIFEMNRRATHILEYISAIQVEMATKGSHGIQQEEGNNSLSIPLDQEYEQSSLEIMDMLSRKLIQFQRKYGPVYQVT